MDEAIVSLLAGALATCGTSYPLTLASVPDVLSDAAPTLLPIHINGAWRRDQDAATYVHRLMELVRRRACLAPKQRVRSEPTLDDLPGLGEAGSWGRRMVTDLQAYTRGELTWSDLDRGVLLEGPPGTGKSTFARALANSAGIALVASSLAQWQGHGEGHLGTLLSAMQGTFAQARKLAPCILLLDEIDSFPTRAAVTHRHRDYVVQVINALLEQLDGAIERRGVVVIGTCNDGAGLDPAILRAGRLERVIRLTWPDTAGMVDILRVHLGVALREDNLEDLAAAAVMRQAVGADAEQWCRGARRRARAAGRPMILADLVEEIGPPPAFHTADAVRRMAIHEAGHVVAFAQMGSGVVKSVMVDPVIGAKSSTLVDTVELYREAPHATRGQAMLQIRAALAGRAAEEVILGDPSGGAGGSYQSDLARATTIACLIVASSGLDDHPSHLVFLCAADDSKKLEQMMLMPDIRERAARLLREAYNEALELIRKHQAGVKLIASALIEHGSLSGSEAEAFLTLPSSGLQA